MKVSIISDLHLTHHAMPELDHQGADMVINAGDTHHMPEFRPSEFFSVMGLDNERITRAVLAIHDYGTRDGATAARVSAALQKEGFTREEIIAAVERFSVETTPPEATP